ncbi:hypothetical protein K439DRAFT_1062353 [Ramaria rubella]|nr:hypothetical protein K439DRAFT_1062353 [Ramaria rubella]
MVDRVAQISQLNLGPGSATVLDRLNISTCFDIAAAYQALEELRIALASEANGPTRTRFLVVDPLTPLFAPILSAESSQGHAIMTTFMRQLSSVARTYSLTVLATNTSVQAHPQNPYSAFSTTTTKPALGPSFTFLTDETLWLSSAQKLKLQREPGTEIPGAEIFIAEVFRSHSTLCKTWCAFVIRHGVSFERFVLADHIQHG